MIQEIVDGENKKNRTAIRQSVTSLRQKELNCPAVRSINIVPRWESRTRVVEKSTFSHKGEGMTLQEFFTENPRIAIAFSGGTDSAYLAL